MEQYWKQLGFTFYLQQGNCYILYKKVLRGVEYMMAKNIQQSQPITCIDPYGLWNSQNWRPFKNLTELSRLEPLFSPAEQKKIML